MMRPTTAHTAYHFLCESAAHGDIEILISVLILLRPQCKDTPASASKQGQRRIKPPTAYHFLCASAARGQTLGFPFEFDGTCL